jgi:colanic acid biosynthesis glycosyl transferase WcaI
MRMLLVSRSFWPEPTGIGLYTGELADWLHDRGHTLGIVTTAPHYPGWSVPPQERTPLWRLDRRKPYRVLRCPSFIPRQPSGFSRVASAASLGLSALPALLAEATRMKPDVIAAVSPTIAVAPAVLLAAPLCGARTWLHVQDLEVDAAIGLGMMRGSALRRGALGAERRLLRSFDCVTTISAAMRAHLVGKGVADIEVVPNWVDTSEITPLRGPSPFRRAHGIPTETVVALYSGSLVAKQGLELIVEAARRLADRQNILIVICGEGPLAGALHAAAIGLERVRFLPLQPRERLNDLLNAADIHLLAQARNLADLVMPSKLGPMLASARPVIASVDPQGSIAKAIGAAGLVVPVGDADAFAAAIDQLARAPDRRRAMGERGREAAVRELERNMVLARVDALLTALCAKSSPPAAARRVADKP